jgi:hypothetical protein
MPFVRCPSTAYNDQGCCIKEVGPFGRIAGSVARTMLKAARSTISDRTYSTPTSVLIIWLTQGKSGLKPVAAL